MPQIRIPKSFSTSPQMWATVSQTAKNEGVSQSAIVNKALERFFSTKVTRGDWDTISDDDGYDPKEFYTASEDRKGHDLQIRLRVPKNLAGLIGRVVGSGAIPEYRTQQDFYRDAMTHRAYQVAHWIDDGELAREITLAILQAEEDFISQSRRDAEQLMESTRSNLEDAIRRGDNSWVLEHIKDRYLKLSSLPEAYREGYTKMLAEFKERASGKSHPVLNVVEGGL